MLTSDSLFPLNEGERRRLAGALCGDPRGAGAAHALKGGACCAFVLGDAASPVAALVEVAGLPREPSGFGEPRFLCELLWAVQGWDCVLVDARIAQALGERFTQASGISVRYHEAIGFVLSQPAPRYTHPQVRMLSPADRPMLERASDDLYICGYESQASGLVHGYAAGAVDEGELVAIAHAHAITGGHAEVSVFTRAKHRGQGFSTAAASLVVQAIHRDGGKPVWSVLHDNHASLRVAAKLGFEARFHNRFVIKN